MTVIADRRARKVDSMFLENMASGWEILRAKGEERY